MTFTIRQSVPNQKLRAASVAAALAAFTAFSSFEGGIAWAADTTAAPPAVKAAEGSYRIGLGDTLDVEVMGKPELSRSTTVMPDGTITYPFLGQIAAKGLTLPQITDRLTAGLRTQLSNPLVTVTLSKRQAAQVSVLGAVRSPGKRTMEDGWRVLDVLADAGGLSVVRPEWAEATLVRGDGSAAIPINVARLYGNGDATQNLPLQAGDVLLVRERDSSQTMVQVLGEVTKPGPIAAPSDGSLVEALSLAGGPTTRAALSRASIMRSGKTIAVDLRSFVGNGGGGSGTPPPDPNLKLQPGDTLVIPANERLFSVLGAVNRPGQVTYPESGQVSPLLALSLAGGEVQGADLKNAALVRPDATPGKDPTVYPIDLESLLQGKAKVGGDSGAQTVRPGDVLFIPAKRQGHGGPHLADALSVLPLIGLFVR